MDVKDSNGTLLSESDSVTLIKDLKVKGSSLTLKRGTVVKNIRLTNSAAEIESRAGGSTMVLKTEFLKKALVGCLKAFLLVMLLCSGSHGRAQAQAQAHIRLRVEPDTKHFWCRYTLTLPTDTTTRVLLNLNKQFTIQAVRGPRLRAVRIAPYFYPVFQDSLQGIALRYAGPARSPRRITVTYEGTLTARYATENVLEFSRSTFWLPARPYQEDELLTYTLDVTVPPAYSVVSTHASTRARPGRFWFRGRTSTIEPTALVGRHFQRLATLKPGPALALTKAGPLLSADTLLLAAAARIAAYYNHTIGRRDSIQQFSVLLPGTNRNAFGLLDNAVVITYADFDVRKREDLLILAHEISHKWWAYGAISSYEEWLNEAFATYSSLLYLRSSGDTAAFRQELAQRTQAAVGAPAILGFDRTRYDYPTVRRVIYAKGTTVLAALHQHLGEPAFLTLIAASAAQKTTTTAAFLDLVAQQTGEETRRWLLKQLQQ